MCASLPASERNYLNVFNALQTAVLLADLSSGLIIEVNKSAKQLFGASDNDLVGLHLADIMQGEEPDRVRALLRLHGDQPGFNGQVFHIRHKINGTVPVFATLNEIEGADANIIVISLSPADETTPMRSTVNKVKAPYVDPGKKLTRREHEILRLICRGKTNRVIAQQLCISNKNVDTHRTKMMQKLDAHCVVDLVNLAIAKGLA